MSDSGMDLAVGFPGEQMKISLVSGVIASIIFFMVRIRDRSVRQRTENEHQVFLTSNRRLDN